MDDERSGGIHGMRASLPIVLSTAMFGMAADQEKITVKGSTHSGHTIVIEMEEAGKPKELECIDRQTQCVMLSVGMYQMVRSTAGHGQYNDCVNMEVYANKADARRDQPLGEYCLLQP